MGKLTGQMLNGSRSHFFGHPLEAGNIAQIEWVKNATKEFIEKLTDGEKLEAKFKEPYLEADDKNGDGEIPAAKSQWKVCIESDCFIPNCGYSFLEYDNIVIDEDEDEEDAIGVYARKNEKEEYTCPRCGSKYHVDEGGYFKMFFPKMRGYEHFLKEAGIEDGE